MSRGARDAFDALLPRQRGLFGDDEVRGNESVRSDLIDLTLELRMQKPLAIAVTDPARGGGGWVWLPKSAIEFEVRGRGVVVVTLPERLARDKGLI